MPIDARGVVITEERWQQILVALSEDDPSVRESRLAPDRRGPSIRGLVRFEGATFQGPIRFAGLTFCEPAYFDGATFEGQANFRNVIFQGHADFDDVTFAGGATFARATFEDHAGFEDAVFELASHFDSAIFRNYADFEGAHFRRDVSFKESTFQVAHQLGPLLVEGTFWLDDCRFVSRGTVEVAASAVSARAASFAEGVSLSVRSAEVALDNADFARPSTLSRAARWSSTKAMRWSQHPLAEGTSQPKLITLRGAHVAHLSLSDVDLRACRFLRAHGLETINIESSCRWPRTPRGLRYSDRETIAEEHYVRRWDSEATSCPDWIAERDGDADLDARQVAALYRTLRKAREDNKDQSGAGDLYYGEMEMRRRIEMPDGMHRGKVRLLAEKIVVCAYWLLSGYGLKAWRAFAALLLVVAIGAATLRTCGFAQPLSLGRATLVSVESTSSLLRVTHSSQLGRATTTGEVTEVVLRLLGPLLIALWLLALRAGVKR